MANMVEVTQGTTNSVEVAEGEAIVVYDGRSGEIVHVHEEITLPGGQPSDPRELKERAVRLAQELAGRPLGSVKTLSTKRSQLREGVVLRVDVAKEALIEKKVA
jgi:hypothetical protein